MNIAICDDDPASLSVVDGAVGHYIRSHEIRIRTFLYTSTFQLEQAMEKEKFDVILLDIEMPVRDGITFARKLRDQGSSQQIIFLSNMENLVFDAMKVQPYGFIRKKNFIKDITEVLGSFIDSRRNGELYYTAVLRSGEVSVPFSDIIYVESLKHAQYMHVSSLAEPYELFTTLDRLEEELAPQGFLRIHKSFLVHYTYIQRIDFGGVVLTDKTVLPVGRSRQKDLRSQYQELCLKGYNMFR